MGLRSATTQLWLPLTIFPWAVGILLGAAVVSQEVEQRTTLIAWAISSSRRRWLLRKVMILGIITVTLVAIPGALSIALRSAAFPLDDPWANFDLYHARGMVLVAHAFLAFVIAVLTGSVVGKVLPTIVLSVGLCSVALALIWAAFEYWAPLVQLSDDPGSEADPSALVERDYLLSDGRLIAESDLVASAPYADGTHEFHVWYRDNVKPVYFGYRGDMYTDVATRETLAVFGVGVILLGASSLIVSRRRPY